MTHKVTTARSLKYARMIVIECTCGWHESFDADNDYRFDGSLARARQEARWAKIDHLAEAAGA